MFNLFIKIGSGFILEKISLKKLADLIIPKLLNKFNLTSHHKKIGLFALEKNLRINI